MNTTSSLRRFFRPLLATGLFLAALFPLRMHGQSSSSAYPMYYPSGPPATMHATAGAAGFEVPIERTGHYFAFKWRVTAADSVNTGSASTMGFVTASTVAGETNMRSLLVTAYLPSSYISTPVVYTYPGTNYTYTYYTYTSVPACFDWWLVDMTANEEYYQPGIPGPAENLRNVAWRQLGSIPTRSFTIPEARFGHALVAGSPAGGWSPVTPGYYTFGTYSNGTTGTPVSLHWFTGSAPVGAGDFSIADLTDGTRSPLNQANASGAQWVPDYAFYPNASVTFYLPAGEANNLYVLHYQLPGQVQATAALWPTVVSAAFSTATVNAGTKTVPAGAATVTGSVAIGANFWLTRNIDNASSPASPSFFTLTSALASSATPKRWWLSPPGAVVTWDTVTFGIASTRVAQTFTVSQRSSKSPTTPGSTGARLLLTYQDYALNNSANDFHYFTVTALVNRAEAFNLVAQTGSGTEMFTQGRVWVLDGWIPTGGTASTLPAGTPGQFNFALTVAGPEPVAGLTLTAPNGASYPLVPSAPTPLALDDAWHSGTTWPATQRTWTLAQAYTGPMGDWTLTNTTAGHDWSLSLNVGNTTDYLRDLGYRAKVKPLVLNISLSRWALDTVPRLRLLQRDGSDFPVAARVTTQYTSFAADRTAWNNPTYLFVADTYALDGVDYWLYDEETGEESPYNTTDLTNWFALPTPAGLAGTLNPATGTIELRWPLGLAPLEGGFAIERQLNGETTWQTIGTLQANSADPSETLHFSDPNLVFGKIHSYRVRYNYGAGPALRRSASSNPAVITGWRDSDGDGLPDWWELAWGLNSNDPSDANSWLVGSGSTARNLHGSGTGAPPAGNDPPQWESHPRFSLWQTPEYDANSVLTHYILTWDGVAPDGTTVSVERQVGESSWQALTDAPAADLYARIPVPAGSPGFAPPEGEEWNHRLRGDVNSNESVMQLRYKIRSAELWRSQPGFEGVDSNGNSTLHYYKKREWDYTDTWADGSAHLFGATTLNLGGHSISHSFTGIVSTENMQNTHDATFTSSWVGTYGGAYVRVPEWEGFYDKVYSSQGTATYVFSDQAEIHEDLTTDNPKTRTWNHEESASASGGLSSGLEIKSSGHFKRIYTTAEANPDQKSTYVWECTGKDGTLTTKTNRTYDWKTGTPPPNEETNETTDGDWGASLNYNTNENPSQYQYSDEYTAAAFISDSVALLPALPGQDGSQEYFAGAPARDQMSAVLYKGTKMHGSVVAERKFSFSTYGGIYLRQSEYQVDCNDCMPAGRVLMLPENEIVERITGTGTVTETTPARIFTLGDKPGAPTSTGPVQSNVAALSPAAANSGDVPPNAQRVLDSPSMVKMMVDANGDGIIDDTDVTTTEQPYRFWLNDDDDQNAPAPAQRADYTNPQVDGDQDLWDFFPVFLDIQPLVKALPPGPSVKYKLKQADGAVNFVQSNLTRENAFTYQNGLKLPDPPALETGFGTNFTLPPRNVATYQVTAAGVELTEKFLNNIKDHNQGVILVEGRTPTTKPLLLTVEKDGVQVAELSLPLALNARILLLLHGMNSDTAVWKTFVEAKIGTPATSWAVDIKDKEIKATTKPLMTANGVRCYRLRFGFYDQTSARQGLIDVGAPPQPITAANTPGYLGLNGTRCGDFETFDQLGQEVDAAIGALLDPTDNPQYKNAQIVLVGHSRGGLAARTFLQTAGTNDRKSAVVGLLTTGSPHKGSPMGRIYNWLSTHPRPTPNDDDWKTVDFLKQYIDVRRPVIGDLEENSTAITTLNNAVGNLASNVRYGEIIYKKSNLGRLGRDPITGIIYTVFDTVVYPPTLSTAAKTFILGAGKAPSDYHGDGLIPWYDQRFTTLSAFRGVKIDPLTDTTNDVLHTEEPSRVEDLRNQLHVLMPMWFP